MKYPPFFLKKTIITGILIGLNSFTYAHEEDKKKSVIELGKVVVTAQSDPNLINQSSLDSEDIIRFRGTGNADVFSNISSVQSNSLRNEAGSLDLGIRGLQGEGRVPIYIDGSLQSTHTFRGYQGESDRTYIDMDLVTQVEVNKGATLNKYGTGAIGGVVEMRTIGADDIITPGKNWGVLLKGNIFNNNKMPNYSNDGREWPDQFKYLYPDGVIRDEVAQEYYILTDKIKSTDFNNGSATAAFAYKNDIFDAVIGYSKRKVGNYFAGKKGADKTPYAIVSPGQEVVNTSYESNSLIAKLGVNLTNEQKFSFNYRRHNQRAGEVMSAYWYKHTPKDSSNAGLIYHPPAGTEAMPQWEPGSAKVKTYSAEYKYQPLESNLIDLTLGAWYSKADLIQRNGRNSNKNWFGDQYLHSYQDKRHGFNILNKSYFDSMPLVLTYGASYNEERTEPTKQDIYNSRIGDASRNGKRKESSLFANAQLDYSLFSLNVAANMHKSSVFDFVDNDKRTFKRRLDITSQLNIHVNDNIDIYTKFGNTYRNPNLFEATTSKVTFKYDSNHPLKAENSRLWELGINGRYNDLFTKDDSLSFQIGYFHNSVKNYITQGELPATEENILMGRSNFSFVNYDSVTLRGTEISLAYHNPSFFVETGAVFTKDPKICTSSAKPCSVLGDSWSLISTRMPTKKTFRLTVGKYLLDQNLVIGARLKYHSTKTNPRNWLEGTGIGGRAVLEIPAAKTIDLFAKYSINKEMDFTFNVDNLTNKYAFDPGTVIAMPMPGRTIKLGFQIKL